MYPFRAAALLTIAVAPLVRAQEPADTVELRELVVTATRLPQPRALTAASVAVITGDELRAAGIDHVLDALRLHAGLTVVQTGSFGGQTSVFLRGGESDYVKILVDGVPVNDPGGAFDYGALTTDNVARIEILRGPASALYGSDAMTGVIHIFTKDGRGAPHGYASVRGGTYRSRRGEVGLSGGGSVARYALSLSHARSDGLYAFNNEYTNTTLAGRVALTPDARTDIGLNIRYGENRYHFPTDGSGQLADSNAFTFGEMLTLSVDLRRRVVDRLETQLLLSLYELDNGTVDDPDSPADTMGFFATRIRRDVRRTSADARANLSVSEQVVATVGAEIEREAERSVSDFDSEFGPSTSSTDLDRWNRAGYGQVVAEWGSVGIVGGLRIEGNERYGTHVTYRGGVTFQVSPVGPRLRAAYGTAIKEPTFLENFSTGFTIGNPALAPERSETWEVGVAQRLWGDRVTIETSYFDQRFRDLIQFTFAPANVGDPNFFNVGGATARGLEVSARALVGRVYGRAEYTYLLTRVTDAGFDAGPDAAFVEGEGLLRRPRHSLIATAGYAHRRLRGALTVRAVGARSDLYFPAGSFQADRVILPAYAAFDASAEYQVSRPVRGPAVSVSMRIENVFDKGYESVRGFPARGRTVFAGVRAEFGATP